MLGPASGAVAPALAFTSLGGNTVASTLVRANTQGNVGTTTNFTWNGFAGSFVIGAIADDTANNFAAALGPVVGAQGTVESPTNTVTLRSAANAALPVASFTGSAVPQGQLLSSRLLLAARSCLVITAALTSST